MTKVSAKYDLRKYFRKIPKKKVHFFLPSWNFVGAKVLFFVQFIITLLLMNIFDLNFAVYLAIAFHYDVLKGLF